jgi:hypothetical protein
MDLQEIGSEGVDWINLAYVTDQWCVLENVVMKFRVP